jgi:hypothetical protein
MIISSRNNSKWQVTMKNAVFWDVKPCGSCKKEESIISIIRVKGISELGTLAVTSKDELRNVSSYKSHTA